jgi:hypothetical protein
MFSFARIFRVVVGVLAIAVPGFGGLGGPSSIVELTQRADLIVAGIITSPFQPSTPVSFSITVDRVIKGDPGLTGTAVRVSWAGSNPNPSAPVPTVGGNGLWFLQRASNGWLLMPVFGGGPFELTFYHIPMGPILAAYAYGPATPLSDRVASEISSAIESGGGGAFNPQFYALQNGLLDQLQSRVLEVLYQRLAKSASPRQKIIGLSGLIRRGSNVALASAAQAASTFTGYPVESGILLSSVRESFRATDPGSVAALGQAATDPNDANLAFREAAAHALAAIHNQAALPYLATLLDDSDSGMQIEGIRGLGSFANGLGVETSGGIPTLSHLQRPSVAPFSTPDTIKNFALGHDAILANKPSYLQFWKQWWSANRSTLGY